MKPLKPNVMCNMLVDGKPVRTVRIEHAINAAVGFYECSDSNGRLYTLHMTNLTPMQKVPARYREHLFFGVAHIIGQALRAYPEAIEVKTGNLAVETFARRLREAVEAKRLFGYKHSAINEDLFTEHENELSTAIDKEGKLLFGPKAAIKLHKVKENPIGQTAHLTDEPECVISTKDLQHLERIFRLLHDRILTPVPNFVIFDLTPEQIADFESRYDISFSPFENKPNKYQIVA